MIYATMAIAALILAGISLGSAVSCLIAFIRLMEKRDKGSDSRDKGSNRRNGG